MTIIDRTASPLAQLWENPPPSPRIISDVKHFGIEYEMFERTDEGFTAADSLRDAANSGGLAKASLCPYHCRCRECRYDRTGPLMAPQRDGSVAIEFVSRILDVTDPGHLDAVQDWVRLMTAWAGDGGWMPDGYASCGNHIHVAATGGPTRDIFNPDIKTEAFKLINTAYAVYDWESVGDGGCGRLRDYNMKPSAAYLTSECWLSRRHSETFEHRMWNTPRDPERLWAHVGLSVALTRWAFHRAEMRQATTTLPVAEMVDSYSNNIEAFKQGVIDYLPADKRFADAAELLHDNLTVY